MDEKNDRKTLAKYLDEMWSNSWKKTEIIEKIKEIHKDESRRWKLKYAPIHGKFLEAGCGLAQHTFYFMEMGFDIEGIDISKLAIEKAKRFAIEFGYDSKMLKVGDVRDLPYKSNTFSYYLSLGVIEHFKEGPMDALNEAFRVLEPGGIMYVATPQKHNFNWIFGIHKIPKRIAKRFLVRIGYLKNKKTEWVEHHWTLNELKDYVEKAGFRVVDASNVDLKFATEIGLRRKKKFLNKIKPYLFPLFDKLEDGFWGRFGVNNIIVAYKPADWMHCFFCGKLVAAQDLHLKKFSIPTCSHCIKNISEKIVKNYELGKKPFFKIRKYNKSPENDCLEVRECAFCGKQFQLDPLWKDYGFSKPVCKTCLRDPKINLELRNLELKYENTG